MRKIIFKHNDLKRGIPFTIIYFIVALTAIYLYFGDFYKVTDAIDNLGSGKAISEIKIIEVSLKTAVHLRKPLN